MKKPRSPYNTNLAAEFFVLSALYRLGFDATLTLGNKKGVDIVIITGPGKSVTIDVKAVAGPHDWPADNIQTKASGHFYVFLSFEGAISEENLPCPSIWVVPAPEIKSLMKQYSTRRNVSRKLIKEREEYRNAWSLIAR